MKKFVPLFAVLLVLAFAGCTGGGKDAAPTVAPTTAPAVDTVAEGKELFGAKGCDACHTIDGKSGVGPTMKGLYMSKVELDNEQTVTADDAYILERLQNPNATVVKGFTKGAMASAVEGITNADAKALLEYIKSLK